MRTVGATATVRTNADAGGALRRTTLAAYALPMVGFGCASWWVSLYLLKFATDTLLIAPGAMGLVFGLSRLWDAVSDPLTGTASDRTRTRLGRRRPWILASAPLLLLGLAAAWSPPQILSGAPLVAWMGAAVILFYTAQTLFGIPHASLGAELTRSPHERTRVFAARLLFENAGIFAALAALFALESSSRPRDTAAELSLWIGLATVVLVVAGAPRLKVRQSAEGRARTGIAEAMGDVAHNRNARILLVAFFVQELGMASLLMILPYATEYVLHTPGRTALYLVCFLVPMTICIPLWSAVARRAGKKRTWLIGNGVCALAFGGLFLLGPGDEIATIALAACLGIGNGCGRILAPSIQADVVDEDAGRTGERREGAYFAAFAFVQKTATALAVAAAGWTLELSGFTPGAVQEPGTLLAIRTLLSLAPLTALVLASAVLSRLAVDAQEVRNSEPSPKRPSPGRAARDALRAASPTPVGSR